MGEAYGLFTNAIKHRLDDAVKGEVTIDVDKKKDLLHIEIYNHGLKFIRDFDRLSKRIANGDDSIPIIVNEVLGKYKAFVIRRYLY